MREILYRGKPKSKYDYHFFSQSWKDNCRDGFVYGSLVVNKNRDLGDRYYICVTALCSINSCVNNGMTSSRMVITQPTCYNDVEEVGTYLKSKKSVIINLENVGKEDARRVLDFLSGATFMIEGNIQKVSSLIYLMTPRTVEIQNDLENAQANRQQPDQKQSFSWLK